MIKFIEELLKSPPPQFDGEIIDYKPLGSVVNIEKGKQLNKELLSSNGLYPAYNGGISYSGFTDIYNYNENKIIISQGGASAGFVNFIKQKFYANAHCYVILPNESIVINKFIYYVLKNQETHLMDKQHGAGIPALKSSEISSLLIPIPPIRVQTEIVRILDMFSELINELSAELELRKKQYYYYREKLLTFTNDTAEFLTLGEVAELKRGQSLSKKNSQTGDIPVVSGGKEPAFYTNQSNRDGETITVAGSGANSGYLMFWDKPIFVADAFSIKSNKDINLKYIYYFLANMQNDIYRLQSGGGVPHIYPKDLAKIIIPIPPIAEQERIVAILDKFDILVNSISEGIPAEINLRQKQYEYYRNALLSFN